ncbi:MAG: serine/threonine-protein phosphatase [Planctomycetales bacterium]|nr:serine/threonine-protein phosphatase [Planctomycetales bacterium]
MSRQAQTWDDSLTIAVESHVGMRRLNNQDSYVVLPAEDRETWQNRGHLFAVADGMGAHAAGELASKLAVEGVAHNYYKYRSLSPPEAILKAVEETNSEIHRRGQANTEFHNMGTTLSCLLILPQGALVAHVGDSRVYRLRKGVLHQLTFDHSLVWEMRAAGQIRSTGAESGIPRNVITRSLGPNPSVQVDLEGPFLIEPGDQYLICSDGLMARIEDEDIGTVLGTLPPDEAAKYFVNMANVRGGPDNTTVIIVQAEPGSFQCESKTAPPLVVDSSLETMRTVPFWVWVAAGILAVLAVGLFAVSQPIPAVICALLAAAAGIGSYLYLHAGTPGELLAGGRRLGKGPYVQESCAVNTTSIGRIISAVEELISPDAGRSTNSEVQRVLECLKEARQQNEHHAFHDALRLTSVAYRILIEQHQRFMSGGG